MKEESSSQKDLFYKELDELKFDVYKQNGNTYQLIKAARNLLDLSQWSECANSDLQKQLDNAQEDLAEVLKNIEKG